MTTVVRKPAHFKATDVKRAINCVTACGLEIARVSIAPDGTIDIITPSGIDTDTSIWDQEYGEAAQ